MAILPSVTRVMDSSRDDISTAAWKLSGVEDCGITTKEFRGNGKVQKHQQLTLPLETCIRALLDCECRWDADTPLLLRLCNFLSAKPRSEGSGVPLSYQQARASVWSIKSAFRL